MCGKVSCLIGRFFLLLVLSTMVFAKENVSINVKNPMPVYYETVSPAARTQIGNRGLRLAAMVKLEDGKLQAYCYNREQQVSVWTSADNGLTWEQIKVELAKVPVYDRLAEFQKSSKKLPEDFLETDEKDAHLLVLKDGRLLCIYARRTLPNGIFAVISNDKGKTWDTDKPIYLAGSWPDFSGVTFSFELSDGSILTAHSIVLTAESNMNAYGSAVTTKAPPDAHYTDSVVHVLRWRLPGDEGAAIKPAPNPVYPTGLWGFTGSGQQIAYWEKSPTKRVRIPDHYKGAMGRFPNGTILISPLSQYDSNAKICSIYRSDDNGLTWNKIKTQGAALAGKEQSMLCLPDNKTVLLTTQHDGSGTTLYHSADGGVTWAKIDYGDHSLSYKRDLIYLSDGGIYMFNSVGNRQEVEGPNSIAWRIRSTDGGLTWGDRQEVKSWQRRRPFFSEATVFAFDDTHFLKASRINGAHIEGITGVPKPGNDYEMIQSNAFMESFDAGLTWSSPPKIPLDYSDVHAKIIKLSDGRLLCTYRNRSRLPFGVRAIFSEDNGKTWDTDHRILLGAHSTFFGGWQTDIQLPDSSMLTCWAWAYDGPMTFEIIHWELPPPSKGYKPAKLALPLDHGQGEMAGRATENSVILQSRLTQGASLISGDLPGSPGIARFELAKNPEFRNSFKTRWIKALPDYDYIIKTKVAGLKPSTKYYYRLLYGANPGDIAKGRTCSFKTLGGKNAVQKTSFVAVTGMNYFFFHNRPYRGDDKHLGYPALETIRKLRPDFFVGTGDNVYFDWPAKRKSSDKCVTISWCDRAKTVTEMRRKYHEQFIQPRFIDLFANVPTYWEVDDHDYRYDDSDNTLTDKIPTPEMGKRNFREQLPVVDPANPNALTYATFRVSRDLQIWLVEGRSYRSPNKMPDGPDKSIWGEKQKQWLKDTLLASDATFKILISPLPMVGPDAKTKTDNHLGFGGFRHEAQEFFDWLKQNGFLDKNFYIICGDRHWKYHAKHPFGFEEFSTGALVRANAILGFKAGSPKSSDPEGKIQQYYCQLEGEPSGGFLMVTVSPKEHGDAEALFELYDEYGSLAYSYTKDSKDDTNEK